MHQTSGESVSSAEREISVHPADQNVTVEAAVKSVKAACVGA